MSYAPRPSSRSPWIRGVKLLRPRRDHVVMAVEDQRRPVFGADFGREREDLAELVVGDRDVARLEPALDETGGGAQTLDIRRVVGDQALGEDPFVHPAEGSGVRV